MGSYEELKSLIANTIKENGNREITGNILQSILLSIVSSIGAYMTFAGIANQTTDPDVIDQNVFYIALESGDYVAFGLNITSPAIFYNNNGAWQKIDLGIATTASVDNIYTSVNNTDNIVLNEIVLDGLYIPDVSMIYIYLTNNSSQLNVQIIDEKMAIAVNQVVTPGINILYKSDLTPVGYVAISSNEIPVTTFKAKIGTASRDIGTSRMASKISVDNYMQNYSCVIIGDKSMTTDWISNAIIRKGGYTILDLTSKYCHYYCTKDTTLNTDIQTYEEKPDDNALCNYVAALSEVGLPTNPSAIIVICGAYENETNIGTAEEAISISYNSFSDPKSWLSEGSDKILTSSYNIAANICMLRRMFPESQIVLIGPMEINKDHTLEYYDNINRVASTIAEYYGIKYIDMSKAGISDKFGNLSNYVNDTPNEAGQKILQNYFYREINNKLYFMK